MNNNESSHSLSVIIQKKWTSVPHGKLKNEVAVPSKQSLECKQGPGKRLCTFKRVSRNNHPYNFKLDNIVKQYQKLCSSQLQPQSEHFK